MAHTPDPLHFCVTCGQPIGSEEVAAEMLAALSEIEGALDKQIYPEQVRDNFDAPDDCEYAVTITAKQWRTFGQAVTQLERLCKAEPPP
jgi:hypothetical protein